MTGPEALKQQNAAMNVRPVNSIEDIINIREFFKDWVEKPISSTSNTIVAKELRNQIDVSIQSQSGMSIQILGQRILEQNGGNITINNDARHGIFIAYPDELVVLTPNGYYKINRLQKEFPWEVQYDISKWSSSSIVIQADTAMSTLNQQESIQKRVAALRSAKRTWVDGKPVKVGLIPTWVAQNLGGSTMVDVTSENGFTDQVRLDSIRTTSPNDKAILVDNGGIDLNQINVLRNGKTVNVRFDPAQLSALEQGGFEGFSPVITGFQYIKSPFPLLGINAPKQEIQLAKA